MAIAGLIVSVLTFLNVDYIGFARRAVEIGRPLAIGARAEAGANADRCAHPASMLAVGGNEVDAIDKQVLDRPQSRSRRRCDRGGDRQGQRGQFGSPRAHRGRERRQAAGGSMASIEVGDATVGVIAPRCDLKEVCQYDATNAVCLEPQTNAADTANATDVDQRHRRGDTIAGHG